jgi:PKD repeat protein
MRKLFVRRRISAISILAAVLIAVAMLAGSGSSQAALATNLTVSANGPYSGTTGSNVTMTGTVVGATSPQFYWAFGDGATGTGQVVTHAYSTATTYTVSLTVVDTSNGSSGFGSTTVTISGSGSGSLTVSAGGPYSAATGSSVTMTGTVVSATGPQYIWSFGDGATGSGQVVTHAYSSAGSYTVTLTVIDTATSRSGYASTTATIGGGTSGALTVTTGGPYSSGAGTTVTMTGSESGSSNPQYSWSFGDGTTATGAAVTHAYTTAGTYTVTLSVADPSTAQSGSATTTATIGSTVSYQYCNGVLQLSSTYCGTGSLGSSYLGCAACYNGASQYANPYTSSYSSPSGGYTGASQYANPYTSSYSGGAGAAASTAAPAVPRTAAGAPGGAAGAATSGGGGCTSGVSPCAVGQTCAPTGTGSVSCTYANAGTAPGLPTAQIAPSSASSQTTTASVPPVQTIAAPQNVQVTYQPSWNLIAGGAGLPSSSIAAGPYAFPAGASDYQTLTAGQPLQSGAGYWVDLSASTTVSLPDTSSSQSSEPLPAGQWVLIGNSTGSSLTVTGADAVYAYNPTAGTYQQATTLSAGQGAWAYSASGATASFGRPVAALPRPSNEEAVPAEQ